MGVRDPSDAMLPYAVALDVAQPWLNVAASAPPWFGLRGEPSVRGADLDSAYRAFVHAPEWYLTGRSSDAAKAAAEWDYKEEIELLRLEDLDRLGRESPDAGKARHRETTDEIQDIARELDARQSSQEGAQSLPSSVYRPYRGDRPVEEVKSGRGLRGCLLWVVSLVVIGVAVLGVLLSLDIISPRDKPCPLNSLTIPTAAQIAVAGDLFRDVCVKVSGAVIFQDIDELIIEMDRGDYTQQVNVHHPSGLFKTPVPPGVPIALAGWLKVEEDGTYVVHFVPHHESDRGWWQNLRENIAVSDVKPDRPDKMGRYPVPFHPGSAPTRHSVELHQ